MKFQLRRNSRRFWLSISSGLVLCAGIIALVLSAVFAQGFPVRRVDLNDGGIWVTSDKDGLFGRLNRPAGSLDAVFYPPGGARNAYVLDVMQAGSAVVARDRSVGKLFPVDVARGEVQGSDGLAVPSGYQVQLQGGTLAVLDPASGNAWATRVDSGHSMIGLSRLELTQKPLLSVNVGPAALAVGVDGTVHIAAITGRTATLRPDGEGFGEVIAGDLGRQLKQIQVTAVGEQLIVLDPATGDLFVPGSAIAKIPETAAGSTDTSRVALQWPGSANAKVLVATSTTLFGVALSTGEVAPLFKGFSGAPAVPMRMGDCAHAAWAGNSGGYARGCANTPVAKGNLENAQTLVQPVFRANRGVVVLNDLRNGATWDLLEQRRMDNWSLVKPPPAKKPDKNQQTDPNPQTLRDQPPKAVDDNLGARPGRTTLLHVLDNDSDPAGSVLSISAVSAPDVSSAKLSIAPDGQTVAITLAQGSASVHFRYTVDDGRNSAQASVTVEVRASTENEASKLRRGYIAPQWTVVAGGRLAMPVLSDWRDFDGDPMALAGAKVARGTATTRTDGFLDYLAPAEGGKYRISYEVSDGSPKPSTADIAVTVLAPDSTIKVAPKTLPDVARGQVGQPIIIRPLDNDIPGSDPVIPAAKLTLAGEVDEPTGTNVDTHLDLGTVVVTAVRPGSFELHYTAAFGNAPFDAKGVIRVDAMPAPNSPAPPVAMPDTAVLHGQLPTMVDVLANDFDPAGGVLAILHTEPVVAQAKLQVAIVDSQWLRINALDAAASGAPQIVRYTISNGLTSPVVGEVSVTRLPDPPDTTPVPVDDFAAVRSGDTVTVAVLDNDTNAGGAPMTLATNVSNAPALGRLVATAPGAPDPGTAYITGNLVRYVAPEVKTAQPVRVDYVVQNAAGDQAVGRLRITVSPPPGDKNVNRPPIPAPIEVRAVSGQTVAISIPTTGIDPDGDSVTVTGIETAPTQGRIVATNATSISYQAFPTSSGTDSFNYLVIDRFGGVGRAGVRIGITAPGSPQPPVAVDDILTAAPGALLALDVLANDLHTPGDVMSILPLASRNPQLPAGVNLAGALGPVEAIAPELTGKPLVIAYAVTGGIGEPSMATVTVRTRKGYNNPPIAYDAYADPQPGALTAEADVLAQCADIDGDVGKLEITRVFDPQATISGGKVRLPVTDTPRTVGYEVRDADGAVAVGLIHVSTPGSGMPYLKPGAKLDIAKDAKKSIAVADYVIAPSGRNIRLTTTDHIWAAPADGLLSVNNGVSDLDLTSIGGYVGPAALTFEVTDGESLADASGRKAVISIPVQVGPETPVLHCPQEPIAIVEGGADVSVDVTTNCHVWVAQPEQLAKLKYSAAWKQKANGIDLSGDGRSITFTASSGTVPGTTAKAEITVDGTETVPSTLEVKVVAAAPPSFTNLVVDGVKAGDRAETDVAGRIRSVLRDPKVAVVAVVQTSGMPATVTFDHTLVTLVPSAEAHGEMTFEVTATDVTDATRSERHVTGKITLHVLGVPDAPAAPTSGTDVLSHTVDLHWTAGANNGAPIEYYEIAWSGGTQQCPGSPCRIVGLTNNVAYVFTVRAHNLVGWSKRSAASAAIRPDAAPTAVTGLTAGNPQDHSLTLNWQAATADGSPIKRYDISWSGGGSGSSTTTSFNPGGLDNDVRYVFTVVAVNDKGPGPATEVNGQSAGAPAQPGRPTFSSLNSVDRNTRAVSVSWNAVGPNGPGPTTYTLTRSGGGNMTVCADVTATSCPDDGISNDGTIYTYTLIASNAAAAGGPGHTSPPSPGATMEATATPDPITTYNIAPTGVDGQAQLSFDVPPSHGASSTVRCSWSGGSCGSWSYPVGGQSGASRTVGGLNNGQNTAVYLQVCNGSSGGADAGTPCNTAVSRNVTTYGNMNSLSISTSVSGTTVNYTVSVNPNGKAANVRVQSSGRDQSFTTGVGSWSMNFSDNVGYNARDNITVTVSDSGRPTLTQTASATTPPPPPSVSVSPGSTCTGMGCPGATAPDGCRTTCYFIVVTTANFSGNVTCTFNSSLGGSGFVNMSIGPNQTKQSNNWLGDHGGWAEATCAGVTGRSGRWP